MTFQITGPGVYKRRDGERVVLFEKKTSSPYYRWHSDNYDNYTDLGEYHVGQTTLYDIVGFWEESVPKQFGVDTMLTAEQSSSLVDWKTSLKNKAEYDLTKVSERFRALEDGHSLEFGSYITYSPEEIVPQAPDIADQDRPHLWRLLPKTNRVVTKLWVYANSNGKYFDVGRSVEPKCNSYWKCLGAIEGSEIEEEVPV